ncbi:MAG: S41 family peptidase [Bacteroidota bacterium]
MKIKYPNIYKAALTGVCLLVILSCNTPSSTHNSAGGNKTIASPKLSVKAMQGDLFILWSAIKELHPGYGFYTPADSLQKCYDDTKASITSPLSQPGFIAHIYPFLCKLRCGHTQLKPSADYKPDSTKAPQLPFEVLVKNHRAWVTTHQVNQLATGDEIISINGTPTSAIVSHGYDLYCGDGYNETFKELFLSEYDGFEDACNKFYHWTGPYKIELKNKAGILKTIQVAPLPQNFAPPASQGKTVDNYAGWELAKNTGELPLRFFKNGATALFQTKPFAYTDTNSYREAFKQISQRGIKNLVLDLRHNTGGDIRIAANLLGYVADGPFIIIKDVKSRIPNPAINHFARYFDSTRTANFNEGYQPGDKEGEWYHVDTKPVFGRIYGKLPVAKTNHFDGNLYVLIDGATFSSGALFTAALRAQRKNVKFIGRETAGAAEGCNGMTVQKLTLPNTKINVDFPWMRVISAANTPATGRGILPAYTVEYSPEDIVNKRDKDLECAMALIK